MKRAIQSFFTAVTVVMMSGLVACGDDDNPTGPGNIGTIGENDRSTASALAFGIVTPLMRNVFLQDYLDLVTAPGAGVSPVACNPLNLCNTGSAEYCSDPGMLQVNFDACALSGTSLDGSVSLALEGSTGSGTFTLSVGGEFHLTGDVSFGLDSQCFYQTFSNVILTTGCDQNQENCTYVIEMTGYAQWCDPVHMDGEFAVPGYAEFDFSIASLGRHVNVFIASEPEPGFMQVLVQDYNRFQNLLLCTGNITGGSFSCTDPNK